MSTDQERAIDEDRVWRSQVRKAWYLRRHNFETTPNYNDYLEQVEDLVDELVSKQTREEGKKRLEELRKQFSAETAHNIGQHDAERRQREEKLEQERLAKIELQKQLLNKGGFHFLLYMLNNVDKEVDFDRDILTSKTLQLLINLLDKLHATKLLGLLANIEKPLH